MSARRFSIGQRLVAVDTGVVFRVVDVPPRLRIAATGQPAYSYTRVSGLSVTLWVMPQAQMEDGRFVPELPELAA